jgi:hypothetical protein
MGPPSLPPFAFVVVLERWSRDRAGAGLGVDHDHRESANECPPTAFLVAEMSAAAKLGDH